MNEIQNKNKIIFKNKNIIDPILELYRGKIYCQIIKIFIIITTQKLGTKIFSFKKYYPRTLTNLLSSWMFTLYAFKSDNNDSFFPDFIENIDPLKVTLLDFCKYESKDKDYEQIIDEILKEFIVYLKIQIDILDKYKISLYYLNMRNNYNISKKSFEQNRLSEKMLFYKFKINVAFSIKDKRLNNILDNILLPIDVYDDLKKRYTGIPKDMDTIIWIIIFRYQLLGSNNYQLGILPQVIKMMCKDYNLTFECFASAINSTLPNYCSIYHDLEYLFGSKGNFFYTELIEGVYSFNPPYQKNIMDNGIKKLFYFLENADKNNKNLTFIMTLPIWDKEGQEIINQHNKIDYGEFEIIQDVKKSKYLIGIRLISKEDFTYLDHNFKLYKNKTIQNTYVIMLSTDKNIDFSKINNYNFMLN
jgi:phosphorylated CTD-interacting factor 1